MDYLEHAYGTFFVPIGTKKLVAFLYAVYVFNFSYFQAITPFFFILKRKNNIFFFRKIDVEFEDEDLKDLACEGVESMLIDWQGGFLGKVFGLINI